MRLVLLLSVCLLIGSASAAIRGLNPELSSYYSGAQGIFTCIDGSRKIDFSRVNDNYCDCVDGSDEPGTSACYDGRFYCSNKGHEPQLLAAAFVDDGICDCCDGSDEAHGCANTCLEKSSGLVRDLQDQIKSHEEALSLKTAAIQLAALRRDGWAHRIGTIRAEIEAKTIEVQKAQAEKTEAEKIHQERLQARQLAQEEAQEEARKRAEAELEAASKLSQDQAADAAAAGQDEKAVGDSSELEQKEETVEERGRRIASQWTSDPDAAAGEEEEELLQENDASLDAHYDERQDEHADGDFNAELTEIASKLSAAEAQLAALNKEHWELTTISSPEIDFGPNDTFLPLVGKCFTDHVSGFVYEACFFDHAYQSQSNDQQQKFNLGVWKGFSNNHEVAEFWNGDSCPDVAHRSMRVHMSCGPEEKLHNTSEPSTCVYKAYFTTPLVCSSDELLQLSKKLNDLEEQRRAIQAEINADSRKDEL